MYRVSRHKNGLMVVTAEMPHMASVSVGIWVSVGGRYEPAPLCGASHFIEHLLFKGTRIRNAKQISQDIEGIGGYINAFTSEENTCFYSKARSDRFGELLEVLMDMFLNSTFDPVEMEKERNVIKEELAMYLDQPQHQVQEVLNEIMWPDQPLGRSITGTPETLEKMKRSHLVKYRRANYVSRGTLVAVAGNLNHEKVVKAVSRYARHLAEGNKPAFSPAWSRQKKPSVNLVTKPAEQTQMALGIRTCSRHEEQRFALRVLNTLLGENMSSRLFQVVREDHGLAYSIASSLSFFHDAGGLTISAGVETDKLPQAVTLVMRELKRFRRGVPTVKDVRYARDYIIGQLDLSLENTENQMMWMGEQMLGYGKVIPASEIKQKLAKVDGAAVRAVAREYFRPERLNLALVSPLPALNGISKQLNFESH
jgi:predicted Zn-dependent peptidase